MDKKTICLLAGNRSVRNARYRMVLVIVQMILTHRNGVICIKMMQIHAFVIGSASNCSSGRLQDHFELQCMFPDS